MKRALRILAVVVVLAALGTWAACGSRSLWTINNIATETKDPITGLTGVTYKKGFVPGLDFLIASSALAGMLAGASFLFQNKNLGR